jgi:hypothetical protein
LVNKLIDTNDARWKLEDNLKKNTKALVVTNEEIDVEVNADKTKYMVVYWQQNAVQNHNVQINDKPFERVEQIDMWKQP